MMMTDAPVVVAGGGAAGYFAAIRLAELRPDARVIVLEQSSRVLTKVAISGGGRCNVTHHCFEPAALCRHYPRGSKELRGPFHRFQPRDTVAWFEQRGVPLKTEDDGRMFPLSDNSASIVDSLTRRAESLGVETRLRTGLRTFRQRPEGGFELELANGGLLTCATLMIATGGLKEGALAAAIRGVGHTIAPLAPSLFTFHIDDPRIDGLAGLVAENAEVSVEGTRLRQEGPVLITHWGLSGPGILRLSAWGARELQERDYRFALQVNWIGKANARMVPDQLKELRQERARQAVVSHPAWNLPRRLWQRLVEASGIASDTTWSHLPKAAEQALAEQLRSSRFSVTGKSLNKEEFVTCGGVDRREIDFRTMESRLVPGLYFGGEVIDFDGITGGFNLQAAWTTGFLAGEAMTQPARGA